MTKENQQFGSIYDIAIHEELQSSFLDYAVSIVISRAIPDVRDGLKPVHRRVLYAMQENGLFYNKSYRKSAFVVGEVMAKYHPHGNDAIYQTIVGMVQDFSKRYPFLDGQGNWGSVDGDNAAAFRYTEVRMKKICQEVLSDITKDTISFTPNFDESTVEPTLLPSKIPNFLINGTSGIAVGMATFVPPHNLNEVMDACIAFINNSEISDDEIIKYVSGPDFPSGGIICGRAGIIKAYKEGRGSITVRGIATIEEKEKGTAIIITELPYQVIKADLVSKIAQLARDKVIEGISNIRDESNKEGMRVVIELKRDAFPEIVLQSLYKHTSLQTNFGIIMLALLNNKPQIFTLKQAISAFVNHRREIIYKRTLYDRNKAKVQVHILEGLQKIIPNIEEVVKLISKSENAEIAGVELKNRYDLSKEQLASVMELRLQRLTSLERNKISEELNLLLAKIKQLNIILDNKKELDNVVMKEFYEIKEEYGDKRRTLIHDTAIGVFDEASFVSDEEVVITLTKRGYIKRILLTTYEIQHRGGKGKMGMTSLDDSEDIIQDIFIAKNHDELLFFTNLGRVYSKQVYEIPEGSRIAKGRAIVNILPLAPGEFVVKLLCARNLNDLFLVMVTKFGTVKRIEGSYFTKIRQTGIRALTLNENDELEFCIITTGNDSIIMATKNGYGIRFFEKEVRSMGRQAAGVRGIRLTENDEIVGALVVKTGCDVLFVTENGYGKRVQAVQFRIAHRGGRGVRTIPTDGRNGRVIGLASVDDETDIILIDQNGKIIRIAPTEIRTLGRQAMGVRLIRLDKTQKVACVAVIHENEEDEAIERKLNSVDEVSSDISLEELEKEEDIIEEENLIDEKEDFLEDE